MNYLLKNYKIRTFFNLQQNQERHNPENWQIKMMNLELCVSEIYEFKSVALFHHILLKEEA